MLGGHFAAVVNSSYRIEGESAPSRCHTARVSTRALCNLLIGTAYFQVIFNACTFVAQARQHIEAGSQLLGMGRIPAAIESFQRAVDAQPDMAEVTAPLGVPSKNRRFCWFLGDLTAVKQLPNPSPNALAVSPRQAYNALGVAQHQAQRYEAAVASLQACARLMHAAGQPAPVVQINLAKSLRSLGDGSGALQAYQRAIAMNPAYAVAYSAIGEVLFASKRAREALGFLQTAARLEPGPKAYHALGTVARSLPGEGNQQAHDTYFSSKFWIHDSSIHVYSLPGEGNQQTQRLDRCRASRTSGAPDTAPPGQGRPRIVPGRTRALPGCDWAEAERGRVSEGQGAPCGSHRGLPRLHPA